ncbi:hypothetical protein PGT21_020485 [Puccinia graminis f. sp. tritici]|uniref:Uncharacterized protein n=1 Tax=Puccinia graminis f. sp. tritici TaxID=56615 RepID=A0A5B0Q6T1_PUCGR|nr:hypothetical protein PGT21_020485 [Puccinia graminis f. sp. tritici]
MLATLAKLPLMVLLLATKPSKTNEHLLHLDYMPKTEKYQTTILMQNPPVFQSDPNPSGDRTTTLLEKLEHVTGLDKNAIRETERFIGSIPELKRQAIRLETLGIDDIDSLPDPLISMQEEYDSIRQDISQIIQGSRLGSAYNNVQHLEYFENNLKLIHTLKRRFIFGSKKKNEYGEEPSKNGSSINGKIIENLESMMKKNLKFEDREVTNDVEFI